MTVNVRKRRRKIDPDHAKKKAIKKAGKTALTVGQAIASPVIGGMGKGQWEEIAKKSKKRKVRKKPKSNSLYGDWLDSPSKAAKKSRKKFIGVDERDV
tara:strand:- start:359 stop:652 length:294 start_codon:yes stop_codon:yes gene_type:complete